MVLRCRKIKILQLAEVHAKELELKSIKDVISYMIICLK